MRLFSHLKVNITLSLLLICSICLVVILSARSAVHASGTSLTLTITSGPPTTSERINGTGFGANERVTINFDTTALTTTTTSSLGAFFVSIKIPATALPGSHTISAVGQSSGLSAQANFLVRTNWDMFGFIAQHTHWNSYENVVNTTNVVGKCM